MPYASFDYIVPIPLHWTRRAWRGYNQAAEMARVLARLSGKPWIDPLKRCSRRPFQSRVQDRKSSIANVRDVFALTRRGKPLVAGKRILLLDDLMASGATLTAAARELYKAGAEEVIAAVGCRTT